MKFNPIGKLLVVAAFVFSSSIAFGQNSSTNGSASQLDIRANAYGYVQAFSAPPAAVEGNFYYSELWMPGKITLINDKTIEDVLIRYNLRTQLLELKMDLEDTDLKGIKPKYVKSFWLQNPVAATTIYFHNKKNYNLAEKGYFEAIGEGSVRLLGSHEVKLVEGQYVAALDAGVKNDRLMKESNFFVYINGEIVKTPKSPKKWTKLFAAHDIDISNLLEENDIDTRSIAGQQQLVELINKMESSIE